MTGLQSLTSAGLNKLQTPTLHLTDVLSRLYLFQVQHLHNSRTSEGRKLLQVSSTQFLLYTVAPTDSRPLILTNQLNVYRKRGRASRTGTEAGERPPRRVGLKDGGRRASSNRTEQDGWKQHRAESDVDEDRGTSYSCDGRLLDGMNLVPASGL